MKYGSIVLAAGIHGKVIAGAMDDFEPTGFETQERWHNEDLKYDSAVGKIHEEVERRRSLLGNRYPFSLDSGALVYKPSPNLVYEFLLAICNSSTLTSGRHVWLPRLFERLSAGLVAAAFGAHTRYIHTGFPRDPEVGSSFREAMRTVARRTSEWSWGPELGLPSEPTGGDGGCDFVVWHIPPDRRPIGQLFILGQCACGNDWQNKFKDLSIKDLSKWFNPLSHVRPVRCFTTPFHITDLMLIEASRNAGIVFDRTRLVLACFHSDWRVIDWKMKQHMKQLIDLVTN